MNGTNIKKRARGRPRVFNVDDALHQAMLVFWEHGYEGTSMGQLTAAMGITRSSLYQAFGSKQALFFQVVDRYLQTKLQPALEALFGGLGFQEDLRRCLLIISSSATNPQEPSGCLVTCALADSAGPKGDFTSKLQVAFREAEDGIERRLVQAVHEGDLPTTCQTALRASVIAAFARGLTLRGRAGASFDELNLIVEEGLTLFC